MSVLDTKLAKTPFDAAIATASLKEKSRLQKLRDDFDIPKDSPEWIFYAILAGLFDQGALIDAVVSAVKARIRGAVPASPIGAFLSTWMLLAAVAVGIGLVIFASWWTAGMGRAHVTAAMACAAFALVGFVLGWMVFELRHKGGR